MTVIRPNAISGITSITTQNNDLSLYKPSGSFSNLQVGVLTATTFSGNLSGGTVAGSTGTFSGDVNISGGEFKVGTAITIGTAGVVTATKYYGDGSSLTGIAGGVAGINTVGLSTFKDVLVSGISTFSDTINFNSSSSKRLYLYKDGADEFSIYNSSGYAYITHKKSSYLLQIQTNHQVKISSAAAPWKTSATFQPSDGVELYSNNDKRFATTAYGISIHGNMGSNTDGGRIDLTNATTSNWSNNAYARITNDATNGVSQLQFWTQASGGSLTERIRIGSAGQLGIGGATYGSSGQVLTSQGGSAAPQWAAAPADSTKVAKTGDTMTGELTIDTTATASTVCQTLKAPQNERLNVWKNNDNGNGSWYAGGNASNVMDLQWNSYSAQVIKFKNAGDVEVLTGNLKIATSGKGIDFAATSDASGMTSELLDNYEEGSWAPTAYSGATGMNHFGSHYTRIGDMCFLVGYIHQISGATNSAVFKIGGLPFSVNTADEYPGSCALHSSSFTTGSSLFVTAVVSGQQIKFMGTKENQGWYQLVGADNIKNNNTIMFNIAYKCA